MVDLDGLVRYSIKSTELFRRNKAADALEKIYHSVTFSR